MRNANNGSSSPIGDCISSRPVWPGEVTRMSKPHGFSRRRFCGVAAATVAAGPLGLQGFYRRFEAMTDVMTEVETGSEKTEIRPFHVKFSDEELADLRRRINATKWPEPETVTDASQGVQLAT